MKQLTLTLILLSTVVSNIFASDNTLWQKANNLYTQQSYDSAAVLYEQLLTEGNKNALIYYNLGNAYYRLNKIGNAVLNYERCLKLEPKNKQAQENLALTQSRIPNRIQPINEIFFLKWWHNLTQGANATTWAIVAALLFVITIILYSLRRLDKLSSKFPSQALWALNVLCTVALIFAFMSAYQQANYTKAVIMLGDTPFLKQPKDINAESYIPEGTTISIGAPEKEWIETTLPDGRRGWVAIDTIEKI